MSVKGNTTDTTEWNIYVTTPKPLENSKMLGVLKKMILIQVSKLKIILY